MRGGCKLFGAAAKSAVPGSAPHFVTLPLPVHLDSDSKALEIAAHNLFLDLWVEQAHTPALFCTYWRNGKEALTSFSALAEYTMGKKIQNQGPDGFSSNTTVNGSRPASYEDQLGIRNQPNQSANRNSTGPRTELGKSNSSRNALKFGIFSRATLLKGESRSDYNALLEGLWKTFQPEGKAEEILVEKLASILWRYRRLLVAEAAEIRKSSEFLEFDQRRNEQSDAEKLNRKGDEEIKTSPLMPNGLMRDIQNPDVLERCLELFAEMGQEIETNGLDESRDFGFLREIYGYRQYLRQTLCDEYPKYFSTAQLSEKVRQSKGYATPEVCKQGVLHEIDVEVARLTQYQKERESVESNRRRVEILRQSVPDSPGQDRLLRCEAGLDRSLDRTLGQLERLQRMRRGQPLPPQLNVNLS